MDSGHLRLGFLLDGEASDEEVAALAFARDVVEHADTVTLSAVAAGGADLDRFDVLWWHAHEPVSDPATVAACADPIRSFVDAGGGLFCSSRALAQVSALGIDSVPPDATGTESVVDRVGLLWKTVYGGHPAVDGLQGLRHHIRPAGSEAPYARYEDVLPERADVLAATYRGGDDVPTEVTTLQWRIGSGTVFGVGVGMEFAQRDDATTESTRERFVANVLRWLGGAADYETALATGRPKSGTELARYRETLSADHQRPRYHVSPPVNWLNDPNGMIHHDGTYHLFYQYNPGGPYHHTVHWGHAVSEDLIHWEDRPVAMIPDPGGPDRNGCWSGCAVAVEKYGATDEEAPVVPAGQTATDPVRAAEADRVYALYTGGREGWQLPCLATATDDDLTAFEPCSDNPVVDSPPTQLDLLSTPGEPAHFRDHCLVYDGGTWYQLIGTGLQDLGGAVVAYASQDLREWRYVGPTLVTDEVEPGVVWECPELLRYEDGDLLHVSDYGHVRYYVGSFDPETARFDVDSRGTLDPGAFYAPQSLTAPDGRKITIGWLREERSVARQWDAGWAGVMSLPREIEVVDGELHQRPARELQRLRGTRLVDRTLTVTDDTELLEASGESLWLRTHVDIESADLAEAGLVVRASPDGKECTVVRFYDDEIVVDRTDASADPAVADEPVAIDLGDIDGSLTVELFLDGSTLELFVNDRRALATRIYPTRENATRVGAYAAGGAVEMDITVRQMKSAWRGTSDESTTATEESTSADPQSPSES